MKETASDSKVLLHLENDGTKTHIKVEGLPKMLSYRIAECMERNATFAHVILAAGNYYTMKQQEKLRKT